MAVIHYQSVTYEFDNLDQAMTWAKGLGEFVKIKCNGMEIVGKFGVDGIQDGELANGETYSWKKRRRYGS